MFLGRMKMKIFSGCIKILVLGSAVLFSSVQTAQARTCFLPDKSCGAVVETVTYEFKCESGNFQYDSEAACKSANPSLDSQYKVCKEIGSCWQPTCKYVSKDDCVNQSSATSCTVAYSCYVPYDGTNEYPYTDNNLAGCSLIKMASSNGKYKISSLVGTNVSYNPVNERCDWSSVSGCDSIYTTTASSGKVSSRYYWYKSSGNSTYNSIRSLWTEVKGSGNSASCPYNLLRCNNERSTGVNYYSTSKECESANGTGNCTKISTTNKLDCWHYVEKTETCPSGFSTSYSQTCKLPESTCTVVEGSILSDGSAYEKCGGAENDACYDTDYKSTFGGYSSSTYSSFSDLCTAANDYYGIVSPWVEYRCAKGSVNGSACYSSFTVQYRGGGTPEPCAVLYSATPNTSCMSQLGSSTKKTTTTCPSDSYSSKSVCESNTGGNCTSKIVGSLTCWYYSGPTETCPSGFSTSYSQTCNLPEKTCSVIVSNGYSSESCIGTQNDACSDNGYKSTFGNYSSSVYSSFDDLCFAANGSYSDGISPWVEYRCAKGSVNGSACYSSFTVQYRGYNTPEPCAELYNATPNTNCMKQLGL
jgi:hypothetical protein